MPRSKGRKKEGEKRRATLFASAALSGQIRLEHLFSWLQLSHLAAIVCRSAQNSAPTVQPPGSTRDACSTRLRARVQRGGDDEATAGGSCVVLYQRATNTAIPDDKGERVAGVRGQPGPVAGVRPINGNGNRHGGWTPPRDRSRRLSFVFLDK